MTDPTSDLAPLRAPGPQVDILARARPPPSCRIPLLAHELLIEPDGAELEGHRRARHVEEPGPVDALTHQVPRLVPPRLQALHPVAAGAGVVQAEALDVEDLPSRSLLLGHGLGEAGQVAIREDVPVEELRLAGGLPVELVRDPMVQVQAAIVQHLADPSEEARVVGDPHVLDDPDGRDLVVAGAGGEVPDVQVLHLAPAGQALSRDAGLGPLRLLPGERHPVGAHAMVLGGPDGEAAPAAADVEHGLAGLETQLPAHQLELVRLRLLEFAVGIAVVGARVDHEGIQEQLVEGVRDVVVMRDRLGIELLGARCLHAGVSFIPKMEPKTTWRRAVAEPRAARTVSRATPSGSRDTWRPIQVGSPAPYRATTACA